MLVFSNVQWITFYFVAFVQSNLSNREQALERPIRCCFVNSRHTTKHTTPHGGSLVFNERLNTQIVLRLLNVAIIECKSLNVCLLACVCVCFLSDPVSLFVSCT